MEPRRTALLALLSGASLLAPTPARAQLTQRLAVHVEGGVSALLSSPESDAYGLGFGLGVRPSVRLVGPLWVHLTAAYARWAEGAQANGPAALWTVGAGLTVAPVVSPGAGRVLIQAEGGYGLTGANAEGRASFAGAVGWLFPLGRSVIELGPVFRFGAVLPDGAAGSSAALLGTGGVTVGLRAPLAPRDRDADGVEDGADRCPDEPAGTRPDTERPGCPIFDRDGDGVPDAEDVCADEAEGPRPDSLRRGCPIADSDGDGIHDATDRCPNEREDLDGFEDTDGCPETDNDRDGVPDAEDRCPSEAETVNGFEDSDGCPDTAPAVVSTPGGAISLREPPRFVAGEAALDPASHPALDAFAAALEARDDVRRVTVVCHAEAPGGRDAVRLARRRAAALATYLHAHGLRRRPRARGVASDPPGAVRVDVELRGGGRSPGHSSRHHRRHR
ncbi:MAG: thrombospondin type 3 repeat-containing protein [Polyangiales bacterium]